MQNLGSPGSAGFLSIVTKLLKRDLYKEIHRNMLSIRDLLDVGDFV